MSKKSIIGLSLIALLTSACAPSLEVARAPTHYGSPLPQAEERDDELCIKLDKSARNWGTVTKISAGIAGTTGVTTIVTTDKDLATGLAVAAIVAGSVAAGSAWAHEHATASWARECAK